MAAIFVAVGIAWFGSLSAPFVLDDNSSVLKNASIRHLWPPTWLQPPATAGETVSGRPILNLSFALNYTVGANAVTGYRLLNILIHASAGFLLYGILRRTLNLIQRCGQNDQESIEPLASFLPLTVALLWALHPLQTAAVTYVVQRAEVLAGLFFLATLYAFIRAAEIQLKVPSAQIRSESDHTWPELGSRGWFVISFGACLLGTGTKETIVAAPIVVLLYDRAFLAGSLRTALRARRCIHGALFATWLPLSLLVALNHGRGGSVGVGEQIGVWTYALTQFHAIVRYLGLALWPVGQVFDYGVPSVAGLNEIWPQFLLLSGLIAGAGWALIRNRPVGFLGSCFFLILAPSSSVIPIVTQTMAEHRMYLALAIPITLLVTAAGKLAKVCENQTQSQHSPDFRRLTRWFLPGVGLAAMVALAAATMARNGIYRSELKLWNDTVAKRPDNARAHHNLGIALLRDGRTDEALQEFRRAIALRPNHAFAHFQIGTIWLTKRQWAVSIPHFEAALAADPHFIDAHVNLGQALNGLGRMDDAIAQYRAALEVDPTAQDARTNLATLLLARGQTKEAEAILREVLIAAPDFAEAHYHLGLVLEKKGDVAGAEREFNTAIRLKSELAPAHLALGNRRSALGDSEAAERFYREVLRLDSGSAEAHFGLGNLRARQKDFTSAIQEYNQALSLAPNHIQARNNLANCQLMIGQIAEAVMNYENVARARPDDLAVKRNLELARGLLRGR